MRRLSRRSTPRAVTDSPREIRRKIKLELYPEIPAKLFKGRPKDRNECRSLTHRPCPWVACKYHLYLDVNERTGAIKVNFPDLEVWQLPETCALDVADRGENTLDVIGSLMNLSRERIRQIEVLLYKKLQKFRGRLLVEGALYENADKKGR